MRHEAGPSAQVLARFGVAEPARRLVGGGGRSWLAGQLVFKPDTDPDLLAWQVDQLRRIDRSAVRLADPIPTIDGKWTREGWSASTFLAGVDAVADVDAVTGADARPGHPESPRSDASRWGAVIDAGRAFHRATAVLPRPDFLDRVDSWWTTADRVAWSERDIGVDPAVHDIVRRLRAAVTRLGEPQLMHGDLTGNVLFQPGEPPAIIDISLYWRAPAYAEGIVVADAMTWHGAPASLVDELAVPLGAVARGLLFRVITSQLRAQAVGESLDDEATRYAQVVSMLGL